MWYYSRAMTMVKLVLSSCSLKCHGRNSIIRRSLSSSSEIGARFASERENGDKCPFRSSVRCLVWDSYMMELVSATKWSNHMNKAQDSRQAWVGIVRTTEAAVRTDKSTGMQPGMRKIPSAQLGSWKWSSCCISLSLISTFVK